MVIWRKLSSQENNIFNNIFLVRGDRGRSGGPVIRDMRRRVSFHKFFTFEIRLFSEAEAEAAQEVEAEVAVELGATTEVTAGATAEAEAAAVDEAVAELEVLCTDERRRF